MSMETDKPKFPKKAFLSRARSSSTSISSPSSSELSSYGNRTYSGLDLLADGSEMLANRQLRDLREDLAYSKDDTNGSFSKRNRDDSLSYASLPDEMKVSFSELEETGININDLNFDACPQLIEDAAPSNVTLDLTPNPDDLVEGEAEILQYSSAVSSTSCSDKHKKSNSYSSDAQSYDPYCNKDPNRRDLSNVNAAATYVPISRSESENQSTVISSNLNATQTSGRGSDSSKMNKAGLTGSQSAGSDIGSLIQASSSALSEETGYQNWDTVTELPWADDRLMEEISQVSTTVGSSTEDIPKKKRRTSSMSKNRKMDNILCQVCGDLAAGFYCGAYICEACKKFYMRAFKQEKLKYVCLRDKKCVITKESRVQCQYCRYQKCLSLNMYCPKQGSEGDSNKETQMSDIPCRVCSAPSSGFHFGAITCEGCKGFFRRMAKEREPQRYQCTKDGNCDINMVTRNLCKACRYRACLKVGMSVQGSRIGRQPNAVKHEISLELKQGVKNPSNKERHTSGPVEIKKEPRRKRHTSSPIVIEDGQQKHRHTSGPVKIKQEPQEFREGCCMSGIRKSWEGWGTDEVQPVLEHSVELPGLISSKSFPRSPLVASKGKSGTIFRDMLLNNVSSENTSEVGGKSKDNIPEKKIPSEVPLSANVSLDNVSCTSAGTQNIDSQKPELQGEGTQIPPSKDITLQTSSSKWNPSAISSIIPQSVSYETDTDTSSVSDEEQTARHSEMMTLINNIIEAGRCLDLINYRVFDTDLFAECKWVVEDVKEKFQNRYMDPKFQGKVFDVDMSIYDTHETAWTFMMNGFNQHAYNTIKFAKSIPGFRTLPIHDQSILLQSSIYPIVLLYLSKVYDVETKTYNYFNFTKQEEAVILKLFPMLGALVQHFQHVGEMVTTLKLTNEEYILLSAILLCPSEVSGLKEPAKVEAVQNRMSSALQYYEENTYLDGTVRYGSLLLRIAELVQCMLQHRLAVGLLLTAHPELRHVKTGQLFEELVTECTGVK